MRRTADGKLPCGSESDHDGVWRDFVRDWRVYAEEQAALSRRLSSGLIEAVSVLGALEGRKDLLYVSSGLARMPGLAINEYLAELCPEAQLHIRREMTGYDLASVLHQATAHANRSRVTVHSLDAGGLRPLSAATVRSEDARFRLSGRSSELRTANLQSGLFTVAEDTGGRTILNANQPFEALLDIRDDVEHGYVLGFSPARQPDVRTHHVRVSLKETRKGVELRFRRTYVDRSDEEVLIGRLLAALQLGWGGNPLGVTAAIGEPEAVSRRVVQAPVRIAVPSAAIASADVRSAGDIGVEIVGVAMDSKGRRTVVRRRHLAVEEAIGGSHLFEIRMKLPPEHYRVGISLELESSGHTSYLVVEGDLRETATDGSASTHGGRGIRHDPVLLRYEGNDGSTAAVAHAARGAASIRPSGGSS